MYPGPKGDKRSKKERKNKFPKFYERNDPKSFEHLILNGIVLPNNEQKRSTVVHKDFFNDFEDDFDDETI